jgi:transposase
MRNGEQGITENEAEVVETTENSLEDYQPGENESATETARNIANLLSKEDGIREDSEESEEPIEEQSEEGSSEGDTETPVVETAAQQAARQRDEKGKFVKQPQASKENDPELQPPASLTAAQKKAFINMPEGLKRETHRIFRDQQAQFTRKQQELSESLKRSEGVMTTARSYITQNNLVDNQGRLYSEDRLVAELISAHHNIASDPDRYIAQMIQSTGANPENIGSYLRGEAPSGVNISNDPHFRAVQSELQSVKQLLASQEKAQVDSRVAPMASQLEAVMREIDPASGEYKYPELHDEEFLESTKPIVKMLRRKDPSMSFGEAVKKAHASLTGKAYSPINQNTVAPARSNNLERARSAAVSVRGRIAPVGSGLSDINDLPMSEIPQSAAETARMIYKRLQG